MELDRERMLAKAAYILEQVEAIRHLTNTRNMEAITGDAWMLKGLKYSLQTAVEAMIDMVYHISAKRFAHAPADARDALRVLTENGIFTQEEFEVYTSMVGFRNKVVHGYQQVSPERVYEAATEELGDFEKFLNSIQSLLKQ
ncbi:toxin-antitoxin system antitoxin subunit [Clostridiales bacterium PH28_bin88]|nr:toxin-antitoxin system antitoxin subunit [Clostridiales bacterium PH28_bin88]